MRITLIMHIIAGGLAIVSGFIALFAAKGERLHRRSGMLFVYTMLTMTLSGALMAALTGVHFSVIGGLLTAYLVFTAVNTVRPLVPGSHWPDIGAMLVAWSVGVASITMGLQGGNFTAGVLIFGSVALLAGLADLRMIRAGGVRGTARIVRHLWRMCLALWIATASFFLGQAKVIPKPIRIPALLAAPVLIVLFVMLYWLWRVRFSKGARRERAFTAAVAVPERI